MQNEAYRSAKQYNMLHMVNFHSYEIMFHSINRNLLNSREIKKWDHLRQTLNFHGLIHLRHLKNHGQAQVTREKD